MTRFSCPRCGKHLLVPEGCDGKSTKCPNCGRGVQIPKQAIPAAAVSGRRLPPGCSPAAPLKAHPPGPAPKAVRRGGQLLIFLVCGNLVLAAGLTSALYVIFSRQTQERPDLTSAANQTKNESPPAPRQSPVEPIPKQPADRREPPNEKPQGAAEIPPKPPPVGPLPDNPAPATDAEKAAKDLDRLISQLASPDKPQVVQAAQAINKLGSSAARAAEALCQAITTDDLDIRAEVSAALLRVRPDLQPDVLEIVVGGRSGGAEKGLQNLLLMGEKAKPALPVLFFRLEQLIKKVKNPPPGLFFPPANELGLTIRALLKIDLENPALFDACVDLVEFNPKDARLENIHANAMSALGMIGAKSPGRRGKVVAILIPRLGTPDEPNFAAIRAIGGQGVAAKDALPILKRFTVAPGPGTRKAAADAIRVIEQSDQGRPPDEKPPEKEEPKPKDPPAKLPKPPTLDPSLGGTRKEAVVIKRRKETSDEDLRKQLLSVPEVGLDQAAASVLYAPLLGATAPGGGILPPGIGGIPPGGSKTPPGGGMPPPALEPDYGRRSLAAQAMSQKRPELTSFPWRTGPDCQLGKESAERLHVLSINLRTCLRASAPSGDIRPDPDRLRGQLLGAVAPGGSGISPGGGFIPPGGAVQTKPSEWRQPGAIPTLVQLLQSENTPIRLFLVEMLSHIEGKEAGVALAQRALFDLSPQVREKAVQALAGRPMAEYRQALVDGFRYPWPAVADHAAETLVALKDRDSLPTLIELLTEPDPKLPVPVKEKGKEVLATRELVRLNHMSNCMLCHAPSLSKEDLVRGRVPIPGEDPPPLYYAETSGLFVRADTTYLRQDFSVVQPVASSGKWPGNQRFDYLVRTRPSTRAERTRFEQPQKANPNPDTYEQREALLFALRELTGKDLGTSSEDWKPLLKPGATKEEPKEQKPKKDD
jgi:hypothetical protein